MEVEIEPSNFHHEIWEQARTLLGQLCLHPDGADIAAQLNALNDKIIKANRENGFPEDKLSLFTIDVGTFSRTFASAAPYRERLQKSHADEGHPGENDLTIYEFVAAGQFGKGFGKSYTESPDSTMLRLGAAEDLENKKLSDMAIAGVASVRRLPENEPKGGWCNEAKTIVLVGFGEDPLDFKWYARTVLGQQFGQKVVGEEIDGYRSDAGQERPPKAIPRKQRALTSCKTLTVDEEISGIDNVGETLNGMEEMMKKMKDLVHAVARMTSQTTRR
ncbi:hypothetical protein LTR64_000758 [Lithohypha guttulata]|uniref:uncharacterized protein n=1 Tax=Lithohypha guttulata TaxID=1690604 RepID=UPI002DDF589A|nr:hypothetical protein LTR51_005473 [Lithohypha guttulata]